MQHDAAQTYFPFKKVSGHDEALEWWDLGSKRLELERSTLPGQA